MFFKVNHKIISHCSQRPVGSIRDCVWTDIVMRLKPFSFGHSPKYLSDIQMWRIWWQEEKVQASFFPQRTQGEKLFRLVNGGVVRHYDHLALDDEREAGKEVNHPVGIYAFVCSRPMGSAISIHHGEEIEQCAMQVRHIDVLLGKFPAVGHIRFLKIWDSSPKSSSIVPLCHSCPPTLGELTPCAFNRTPCILYGKRAMDHCDTRFPAQISASESIQIS